MFTFFGSNSSGWGGRGLLADCEARRRCEGLPGRGEGSWWLSGQPCWDYDELSVLLACRGIGNQQRDWISALLLFKKSCPNWDVLLRGGYCVKCIFVINPAQPVAGKSCFFKVRLGWRTAVAVLITASLTNDLPEFLVLASGDMWAVTTGQDWPTARTMESSGKCYWSYCCFSSVFGDS